MGKRIIQQARGHGSLTYRVRKSAFRHKIKYPRKNIEGEAEIVKIFNSPGHSAPLMKIKISEEVFYSPAFKGAFEGQKIIIGGKKIEDGNILNLKEMPLGTKIYNIESRPGDGGKFIRTAGSSAIINKKSEKGIIVIMPSKKEKIINEKCRATVGTIAGHGQKEKPVIKAGKKYYIKKSKSKLWPRTSAVKMNVIDHPFGSGRGKRIKSKIAKRNSPPGKKVGLIRPRRTGRKKR